jgi:outer membrane protein assembly factor BamE (lipoprotein component of BamABCDE complex)
MPKAKDAVARRLNNAVKDFANADQELANTSKLGDNMKQAALRMMMAVMLGLVVAGCTAQYKKHGYVPPQAELDRIELGIDTRDTVAAILGRPSTAGLLNDVGWYYVESRWRTVGAMAPVEQDRQVVAITFTPEGVVENVERFGLEQGQVVALSRRVTKPNVKSAGFLRQLFGNLGRVNTENLLSQ